MGLFKKPQDQKYKERPDFSNVRVGGTWTAPPAAPTQVRTYVVMEGDSLSKIAKREYGDANQWRRIFEANRDVIKDHELIYPGQRLNIPQL